VEQYRVVWSIAALADVEAIASVIARDSERYAATVVERLLESAVSLGNLSERGRVVPETGDEAIREIFVYSWRLIYRIQPGIVRILAVVHQKQNLRPEGSRFRRS